MINEKSDFSYSGWICPKGSLALTLNSLEATMDCQFRFEILSTKEQFVVDSPSITVSGIWLGAQIVEVTNKLTMQSLEYKTTIDFYSGKENYLKGDITSLKTNQVVGNIYGNVDKKLFFDSKLTKIEKLLYDTSILKIPKIKTAKLSEQKENESRKKWHKTAFAIFNKDDKTAALEKTIIENEKPKKKILKLNYLIMMVKIGLIKNQYYQN